MPPVRPRLQTRPILPHSGTVHRQKPRPPKPGDYRRITVQENGDSLKTAKFGAKRSLSAKRPSPHGSSKKNAGKSSKPAPPRERIRPRRRPPPEPTRNRRIHQVPAARQTPRQPIPRTRLAQNRCRHIPRMEQNRPRLPPPCQAPGIPQHRPATVSPPTRTSSNSASTTPTPAKSQPAMPPDRKSVV